MKKVSLLLIFVVLGMHLMAQPKPRVIILATGGTIAGSGASSTKAAYTAGELGIDVLLDAVPQIKNLAEIKGEQIAKLGSQDMNIETWLKLSKRINEIMENNEADAVVVTHGTDTKEETAYFLSLTVNSTKPVVLVGAMRPATAMSQDGNRNLLDAVMVASSPQSQNMGVIVVANEFVFDARDVSKTSTTNTSAFKNKNFGPIGLIYDGKVSYYYKPLRNQGVRFDVSKLSTLPDIEIIYGYADAKPYLVNASVQNGAKGIIYAGMGNGNFNEPVGVALKDAIKAGVIVCRASRTGSGRVTLLNEIDDAKFGFIVSDDLTPEKARILLMLGLTTTQDKSVLQNMFFEY